MLLASPAHTVALRTPLVADPESRTEGTSGLLMGTTMMLAYMDMGAGMVTGMVEGVTEALSAQPIKAEDKAKLDQGKAEMAAKSAKLKTSCDRPDGSTLAGRAGRDRHAAFRARGRARPSHHVSLLMGLLPERVRASHLRLASSVRLLRREPVATWC